MHKRRLTFLSVAALVGAFLLIGGWALSSDPFTPSRRLPDGSLLTFAGVTSDNRKEFVYGKWWQKLLYPHLPRPLRASLGCTVVSGAFQGPNSLCVWTFRRGGSPDGMDYRNVAVFDEAGREASVEHWTTVRAPDGRGMLQGWVFRRFPRRTPTLGFRIYGDPPKHDGAVLAEFTTSNPTPGPYPVWVPEAQPIRKSDGDLEVTLKRLAAGGLPNRGQIETADAVFGFSRAGHPVSGWRPLRFTASDATGNRWEPAVWNVRSDRDGLHCLLTGAFKQESEVWKLGVEFYHASAFQPRELWTVRNVAVPAKGKFTRSQATASREGAELRLLGIAGEQALLPGGDPGYNVSTRAQATVQVRFDRALKGHRLALVRAVDDQGRPVRTAFNYREGDLCVFALKVPPGARALDFTFAAHRSRRVTFLVKPVTHASRGRLAAPPPAP